MGNFFASPAGEAKPKQYSVTSLSNPLQMQPVTWYKEPGPPPVTYFDYPDYGDDKGRFAEIVRHLVQYESIHVYYGKFRNIIKQEPDSFEINAQTPINTLAEDKAKGKEEEAKYIFEPSLEGILMFFESEMFGSVFQQAINESQLAKFASRMIAMDRASQNILESLGAAKLESLKLAHRLTNKKQLNSVSGIFALSQ